MKTDAELIAAHENGDDQAFADIVLSHTKEVYRFAYHLSQNSADAEDITQDTFIKAWKHLKRFREGENLKTWLFAIAHHTAIDLIRKRRSRAFSDLLPRSDGGAFADAVPDTEPNPEEVFARAEDSALLARALNALSKDSREVLYLRYNEEMTFDEIGRVLSKPLDTVKSQHRRALLSLKKLLEPIAMHQ